MPSWELGGEENDSIMFLSIVIPVHNSAKHLEKCLVSIYSQLLPIGDFEVICVDDCSTDNSVELINGWIEQYQGLRLIKHVKNKKAGGSRNTGVKSAEGEYVLFIDSDDYFHPGSLLYAYQYQKRHNLDILMLDSSREPQGRSSLKLVHNFQNLKIMTGREFMLANTLPYAPWKYVFKRSLMVDNNIWFVEDVNCEDVDWTHKLAFYAQTMQYQPVLLTHYVLFPYSETGAEYKNINTIRNRFLCGERVLALRGLFTGENEKSLLQNVALGTFYVGVKNMCGSYATPSQKYFILKQIYIPNCDTSVQGMINRIAFYTPRIFSIFSTLVAPFVRGLIALKRLYSGR